MEDLAWKPIIQNVTQARKEHIQDVWPSTGPQILEKLCGHYGIDVTDRRHLNYLMQCLGMYTKALATTALDLHRIEFFGLDQTGAQVLTFSLLQAWAGLILELSVHLPPEVRSGRLKSERIYTPQPDLATLNWSAIAPGPGQIERHRQWRQAAPAGTPTLTAATDQALAMFRDLYTRSGLFAYVSVAACTFLLVVATLVRDGLADEVSAESVARFRDVILVTMYNNLPEHLQAMGRTS